MDEWKSCEIKIAILGESGTGKSSFINAFRGLQNKDKGEGVAEVGTDQTTLVVTPYQSPDHPNLQLFDVPGVNTPTFPQHTYLSAINVNQYDFFILISSERFTDNDLWLAKEIISRKKRFYFVRTKVDQDLTNDQNDHVDHDPDKWIDKTRQNCINLLRRGHVPDPVVFLVSNRNTLLYDFGDLQKRLVDDSPEIIRNAIILSFSAITKEILNEKREVLESRKTGRAVLAVLGALIPIPGVGAAINFTVMKNEMTFYKEQFGIDDRSLQQLASQVGVSIEYLKNHLSLKSCIIFESGTEFRKFCEEAHDQFLVDAIAKVLLPIIGGIISAFKSAPAAVAIQEKLLDICYKEACRVIDYRSEWFKKQPSV
ncbi:interferon-inducible GTPase 1-like [Dreissena polymorpha]|uniref:IRG-type G domain-containing protein n=1 Tax=Dreissena polymorpha TaxID=45954 RepID=A0A9D4E3F9_DREPO|nr:interferon-inducible GTPase 1-like [Dreissena polymorpha]KAH3773112.1 hypothetical protein DPMN_174464 [Dreissena polymorpha]